MAIGIPATIATDRNSPVTAGLFRTAARSRRRRPVIRAASPASCPWLSPVRISYCNRFLHECTPNATPKKPYE